LLGSERSPGKYSYVPTLKEIGYDMSWETFGIVMGPPKIPKDISAKLVKAFEVGANDPEYKKFLAGRNANHFYLPPDQILTYCDEKRKLVRKVMEKVGILKEK
jgi:tripartite-type tricarboxylate transporter receptor subunit TctC